MNGEWVPWYGDPEKYKEKFRLVHDIMEQEAPNVAMVWSPNFFPIIILILIIQETNMSIGLAFHFILIHYAWERSSLETIRLVR